MVKVLNKDTANYEFVTFDKPINKYWNKSNFINYLLFSSSVTCLDYTNQLSNSVHAKYYQSDVLNVHLLDERFFLCRRFLGFPHGFREKEGERTCICGVFSVELLGVGDTHGSWELSHSRSGMFISSKSGIFPVYEISWLPSTESCPKKYY